MGRRVRYFVPKPLSKEQRVWPRILLKRRLAIGRLVSVILVIVLIVVAASVFLYFRNSPPASNVTLSLESAPNAYDAPIYYGLQQGIFGAQGLNVSVQSGSGTAATIAKVAAGDVDFGLADTPGMIFALANSNITNVRVVAILYQENFYAVFYNKADISTIQDLNGASGAMAAPGSSTLTPMFDLFVKLNGLNLTSMNLQYSSSSLFTYLVAQGKVEFTTNEIHNLPDVQAIASESGIQLGYFLLSDYGVSTYGQALLTTTQMIEQHPGTVQEMVRATMESMIMSEQNPAAAVSALSEAQPQLNSTLLLAGFKLDLSCCTTNATSTTNPLVFGWIDPQKMQQTVNLVVEGLSLKEINATSLYDDSFTTPS